jgi:hypothetical protein
MAADDAKPNSAPARLSGPTRLLGAVFRALFILDLIVVTIRVARPQLETVWTAFETPSDVARMVLGFFVCLWLVYNLFTPPKDPDPYRIWFFLGLVLLPLALICTAAIW